MYPWVTAFYRFHCIHIPTPGYVMADQMQKKTKSYHEWTKFIVYTLFMCNFIPQCMHTCTHAHVPAHKQTHKYTHKKNTRVNVYLHILGFTLQLTNVSH